MRVCSAVARTASAWARVRALEGRPGCPFGTEHRATTLRLTLSRAMALLTARLRQECRAWRVRVLSVAALSVSHFSMSWALRSRSFLAPRQGMMWVLARTVQVAWVA